MHPVNGPSSAHNPFSASASERALSASPLNAAAIAAACLVAIASESAVPPPASALTATMTAASAVAAGSSTRKRSRERWRRTDAPSVKASICMRSESGARTSTAWSVANARFCSASAVLTDACGEAGRKTIPFSMMIGVIVGADRAELRARVRRVADKRGEDAQAFQKDPPAAWVIGTLDEAADQLAALRDAGVDRVTCQHLLHDLQASCCSATSSHRECRERGDAGPVLTQRRPEPPAVPLGISRPILAPAVGLIDGRAVDPGSGGTGALVVRIHVVDVDGQAAAGGVL